MDFSFIQSVLATFFSGFWLLFKAWWWLILPCLFYFPAKGLYRWWIHWDLWYKEDNPWVMLEIVPPSEIKKPFRAMEDFFTALFWPLYDAPNWREIWCEGELTNGPYWLSFEVVSFEGDIHFYARVPAAQRVLFESTLYAHYPEVEIQETEDYTKRVPQDIPNKEYEVYGEDYRLYKEDAYPITSYKFFEIRPEEIEEEKKLDPFSSLMESMAKLTKGEQLWVQFIINSILDRDQPWVTEGKAIANKLAKREAPPAEKSIVGEAIRTLLTGKPPFQAEKKEEPIIPPEMKLTPGEKETLQAVESKIAKHGFRTTVRAFYIAKRDAYFSPNGKIVRSYFSHFTSQNLNTLAFIGKTRTKIHYFFRKRRLYGRKRSIFRKYIARFSPLFPKREAMILTAEELATIFHLPVKAALLPPGVPRITAKRGVPPPAIPMEE